MAYRIALADPAPVALERIVRAELDDAIHQLEHGRAEDPVEAVHDARKSLKKVRSLLRLARPGMRAGERRAENLALGDIGRALSGGRDADVMVETVDALAERFAGQVPAATFAALRARLAARAARRRHGSDALVAEQLALLRQARARLTAAELAPGEPGPTPFDGVRRRHLRAGAVRAYARGRGLLAEALKEPTTEALHELRKRVKDLWYHTRLLSEAWPGPMKAQAAELKTLSTLLGDDHDLGVLAELLRAEAEELGAEDADVDEAAVLELVARRRAELQAAAFAQAARIYAESPRAWERRLRGVLDEA
jgi:CHAD domain-containing protein